MGECLASAGVDVGVEVWPEMVHVWHFLAGCVPEADQVISAVATGSAPASVFVTHAGTMTTTIVA